MNQVISTVFRLKMLLSVVFSLIATGVTSTDILSSNTSILFAVLCVMFYSSLSFFDSMSAETIPEFRKEIRQEITYFRDKVLRADAIPDESKQQVWEIFNAIETNLIDGVVSLDFLKSNTYSVETSTARLQHLGRLNIARYENEWERLGVDMETIKRFRKFTERDIVKFFDNVSRIIKSEPFLYRRQKVFKRELIHLVKDLVYDYFMFLEDRRAHANS